MLYFVCTYANTSRFFFQAEDGIRDIGVTGVQTCALPIWRGITPWLPEQYRAASSCARGSPCGSDLLFSSRSPDSSPEKSNVRTPRPSSCDLIAVLFAGAGRR